MDIAHARRPRADDQVVNDAPRSLRAVPDDLTPAERRDWQNLAERRHRKELAEASRRRHAATTDDFAPRRDGAPTPSYEPVPRRGRTQAVYAPAAPQTEPPSPVAAPATAAAPPPPPARTRPASTSQASTRAGRARPATAAQAPAAAPAPAPVQRRAAHPRPAARPAKVRRPLRLPRIADFGAGPDRLAMWAVVLCLFMALVAAATARGDESGGPEQGTAAPVTESSEAAVPNVRD